MRARRFCTTVAAAGLLAVGIPSTATAVGCTYTYDSNGFPKWSGCSTTVAPGKFGPLKMGTTTVASAKASNYLAYNKFCERWDGVQALPDWKRANGKVVWWRGGTKTTKGLRPTATLARARQLYPNLKKTRFIANEYVTGEGWQVYSTKTKSGWLDIYRYNTGDRRNNFFAVRALSVKKPQGFAQDGC